LETRARRCRPAPQSPLTHRHSSIPLRRPGRPARCAGPRARKSCGSPAHRHDFGFAWNDIARLALLALILAIGIGALVTAVLAVLHLARAAAHELGLNL